MGAKYQFMLFLSFYLSPGARVKIFFENNKWDCFEFLVAKSCNWKGSSIITIEFFLRA